MAEVTMDLSELDKLRQDKDNAISETEAKELEIQKLREEMVSVKSDKRTVRITKKSVLHKKIDSSKLIGFIGENFRQHHYRRSTDGNLDVDRAINDGVHNYMQYEGYYSIAFPNEESEEIDFVNFEDVIEKLSKKLELKYKEELVDLRKAKEVYQLNTITLKKEHEIAISSIEQRLRETEKELEGVIFDKDTRKKEIILEEKIIELQKELQKEKSKGFFKKLFNL